MYVFITDAKVRSHSPFFEIYLSTAKSGFNAGLAMQVDFRKYYSEDTLKARSDNFKNLPDVSLLNTPGQFYEGTDQKIELNYMTAKHEVKNWYSKEKLEKLIEVLNAGKSFEEAFVQ